MVNSAAELLVGTLGERTDLRRYGKLYTDRYHEEGSGLIISPGMLAGFEKDVAKILTAEERRARKTLRFFGKELIRKVALIFAQRPTGVMLRKELDALLQPKLAEFHRQHRIIDRIRSDVA